MRSVFKLSPVLVDGMLLVGGRLRHPPVLAQMKHPIILPQKHHILELIVRHFHETSGHSGKEYVLSLIREQFWIVKARVVVCVVALRRLVYLFRHKSYSFGSDL